MAVTIKDVAREAGVSHGTVSRYLNGFVLGDENRRKVEAAIAALDYRVNYAARSLKSNNTYTVGILIRRIVDPFDTSVTSYIQDLLEENGYGTIVCDYRFDLRMLEKKLGFLYERSVDGVVVFAHNDAAEILNRFSEKNIPMVIIDEEPPVSADKVLLDNRGSAMMATRLLIDNRHTRIAAIGGFPESTVARDRMRGYLDALEGARIPFRPEYQTNGRFTLPDGYQAAKRLMASANPPTAIFIANYHMAIGAVSAILEMGLRIPDDVSVVAFDYFEQLDSVSVPLTCVVQPVREIGESVAALLLRRMQGDAVGFPERKVLPGELFVRSSHRSL